MDTEQEINNGLRLSRRDFLKASAGVAVGAAIFFGTGREDAYAITTAAPEQDMLGTNALKEASVFEDSLGRKTVLSKELYSIIPSGIIAQTLLTTLCPEKLVSLSKPIDEDEKALGSL